jgi:predicted kinase
MCRKQSMTGPTLIVVHGAPATGKTCLSQWLAAELRLPALAKDDIKEALFDHFDHRSIEQSDRIDAPSFDLLWLWLERLMAAGTGSYIVETAFANEDNQPRLRQLIRHYGYRVVQIYCHADERVLRERYVERAMTPQRHPGHQDLRRVEGQSIPAESSYQAMDLPGPLIDVDTTDLAAVDYRAIRERLSDMLR